MIKKVLLVLLLLVLSSFYTNNEAPEVMKFNYSGNLPVIQLKVNGVGCRFLIDSGAYFSVIDESTAEYFGFVIDYNNEKIAEGIGGKKSIKNIRNASVEYRGDIINVTLKAIDLRNIRKGLGIVGILGSDYFIENNLSIDYRTKTIYKSRD